MSEGIESTGAKPTRVPPRLVVASIVGLWATYFLLATLRGVVLDYAFSAEFFSRRLIVTVASMVLTLPLWWLLVIMARHPLWRRAAAVMLLGLPIAVLQSAINTAIFHDLDQQAKQRIEREEVSILHGDGGSVVEMRDGRLVVKSEDGSIVEMGNGRMIVRSGKGDKTAIPPEAPVPPVPPAPEASASAAPGTRVVVPAKPSGFWEDNADMILGRYFLLLAWAAIYLALAYAEQARAAERRESGYRQAAQAAELRSLRYQINPHFLFNTLNSLSALVLTGRSEAAERMIQMLSSFYRRSLTADPTGDLPLREEIALQRLYLDIEMQRFPERLKVIFDVPDSLGDVLVPGMILQPLIENAVKYAVAATTRPVMVTIAARSDAGALALSVHDDGPGAAGQAAGGHGIGLANVRDRLRARFGDAGSLQTGVLPEGGFRAVIRLPVERRG